MVAAPHAMAPQEATRGGGPGRRVGVCANARAREDAEYGDYHLLSIHGQSTDETMRSVAQGRLMWYSRHTTIFSPYACPCLSPSDRCHFFGTGIVLEDLFVCNYRPSGAEGSGRLLFARRSRATAVDGFSYQGQLRAADLIVSEASSF